MENFFTFNSLNFFSLVLLILLAVQAKIYFKQGQEIPWKKTLSFMISTQLLDILCWYIATFTGTISVVLSYCLNILLFTSATAFTISLALFLHHLLKGYDKTFYTLKKYFFGVLLTNFILLFVNIPFGFIFSITPENTYVRGSYYFAMILILLIPIFVVLSALIKQYFKNYNYLFERNKAILGLIVANIFILSWLIFVQGEHTPQVTIIFPAITISIIMLHLIIISKTITIDYLTKVQNKFGLENYLNQLPKIMKQYLVGVFFDLDNFKSINDAFGHKEGDATLQEFAQILVGEIKNKDVVARVGGDEFMAVLLINKLEEVNSIVKNIQTQLDERNNKNPAVKIKFSYGISINEPNHPFDKNALMVEADKRMYENKSKNKKAQE